jgi:lipoate-protein ligase A
MRAQSKSDRESARFSCRVLPYMERGGAANMALDMALLESAAEEGAAAIFRTYGWTVPTLSLGYFQPLREATADVRWKGLPIVRRFTGGGAILHHHELTYALALPRTSPFARTPGALYRAVHSAIAGLLEARNVSAIRRAGTIEKNQHHRPFLCFTDTDVEDIVLHGVKIVGSSQRRHSGAVFQHGSLILRRSLLAPELPGLLDLVAVDRSPQAWTTLFATAIPAALGLEPRTSDFTSNETQRASDLEERAFQSRAWTEKR